MRDILDNMPLEHRRVGMGRAIKTIAFLDLSRKPRTTVSNHGRRSETPWAISRGDKVLVQTANSQTYGFYIMLEVLTQTEEGQYVGKVLGPQGYDGPRDVIYPGPTMEFSFDGLRSDDLVYFLEKNVF
jgi:hypothetical protein